MYTLEEIAHIDKIIKGIASRSGFKFKGLSVDDLSQELWLNLLEIGNRKNTDIKDLKFIACTCYSKLVDIQRYEMKRNHYSLDCIDSVAQIQTSDTDIDHKILLDEIYNLFPKGTPERIIIDYWGSYSSTIDINSFIDPGPNSKYKDGYTENDLALLLGFSSSSHRGYRTLRDKVRTRILKYLKAEKD